MKITPEIIAKLEQALEATQFSKPEKAVEWLIRYAAEGAKLECEYGVSTGLLKVADSISPSQPIYQVQAEVVEPEEKVEMDTKSKATKRGAGRPKGTTNIERGWPAAKTRAQIQADYRARERDKIKSYNAMLEVFNHE